MSVSKKWFLGLAAAGLMLGASQAQADLLIELKFNETGTTAVNSGVMGDFELLAWGGDYGIGNGVATDLHSADGLGVSGLAGDRAFDNTASALVPVPSLGNTPTWSGGVAYLNEDPPGDGIVNYTLSGWFKTADTNWGEQADPNRPDGHAASTSLFHHRASSSKEVQLYNSKDWGTNEGALKHVTAAGNNQFNSVDDIWLGVSEWIFFAVTFDAATATVNFYEGSLTNGVALVATESLGLDWTGGALNSAGPFTWGADRNMLAAFDGYMDNLRLHDEALDLAGLEALRSFDAIPEPASLGLLGLGVMALVSRRRCA